jgi:hypothetical protein
MELNKVDLFLLTLPAEKRKQIKFKVITPPPASLIIPVEDLMSEGELWEWNLMMGRGNDIY